MLGSCNLHQLMCVMLFVGELKTLMALDREQQAVYHLLVKATDGGGRFCQANIILTVGGRTAFWPFILREQSKDLSKTSTCSCGSVCSEGRD